MNDREKSRRVSEVNRQIKEAEDPCLKSVLILGKELFHPSIFIDKYDRFSSLEKLEIRRHCVNELDKMQRFSCLIKFRNFIRRLLRKDEVPTRISYPYIEEVIKHLKEKCPKTRNIFRHTSGSYAIVQKITGNRLKNKRVDINYYNVDEVANAVLLYGSRALKNAIPNSVRSVMYKAFSERNIPKIRRISKYLPFIFMPEERFLIRSLIGLFLDVARNERETGVDLEYLIWIFPLGVIPNEKINEYEYYSRKRETTKFIIALDFDLIPSSVVGKVRARV